MVRLTMARFLEAFEGLLNAHNKNMDTARQSWWFEQVKDFDEGAVFKALFHLRHEERFPNYGLILQRIKEQNRNPEIAGVEVECHVRNRINAHCNNGLIVFGDHKLISGKLDERSLGESIANCRHCSPSRNTGLDDQSVLSLLWDKDGGLWTGRGYAERLRIGGVYSWDAELKRASKFIPDDPNKPDRAAEHWKEPTSYGSDPVLALVGSPHHNKSQIEQQRHDNKERVERQRRKEGTSEKSPSGNTSHINF